MIERTGYTILDILSDVGGLQGILISAISFLLNIVNFNYLDNYIVSKLYKTETVTLVVSQTETIKEFCFGNCLLRLFICNRKNRKQIAMEQARSALQKEVDVVRLIRSRRFVEIALKHLLDPVLRKELKL